MNLKQNVSEIRRLFQERQRATKALMQFLLSKGIASSIIDEMLLQLKVKDMSQLKDIVSKRIRVAGELPFQGVHRLAFIGPTGVGKTTTILKLAKHYSILRKKVALMTLDEQKKAFLRKWAAQNEVAFLENDTDFHGDLILIDTEGCNFYLPNRVDVLGERLAWLGENLEVVLTLSAAAKEVDLYGAIHQFSSLCPSSFAFTKLDETLASGVVVSVSVKTDIPIRYISFGYPLPGEIQIADAKKIAHKILTDFNNKEFQFLRQLSIGNFSLDVDNSRIPPQ